MSDIFEYISKEKEATAGRACRVAYTINNAQPVACTIIGDQPFFYMDFEGDFEEEGLFDDADFAILENELMDLKKEIESFDKFSEGFLERDDNKVSDFFEDKDFITKGTKPETQDIKDLIETLSQSRLAKSYIDCAAEYNVEIKYSAQIENAVYERKSKAILINPSLNLEDKILVTTQELRRHFQHRQGALIHPLMFHPDNAVLINRAQICDLVVSMIRVAWELQLAGTKDVWQRVENSSMADLGRAFAREAYLDFRTINNGEAAAAVFEAWFLSDRCRAQDKVLINQMLADYQGYVFDLEDATQNITPTLISALGEMPFGKNYLAAHALTIMNDPIFSDIRDRSNANFLWFIKFERSFRDAEQELHPSKAQTSDIRSDMPKDNAGDAAYDFADQNIQTQQSAEIITLFADETSENVDKDKKNGKRLNGKRDSKRMNKKGADIVYLRRWSGEQ